VLRPVLREEERVTALELFFDLVFVLAITQCTALMASQPTWTGLARGLLVLAALWWPWTGYTWLTGVVNPEEGVVRLSIFGAMAALLVAALCVPTVFEGSALLFAAAYGVVRLAHIVLFTLAGRGDPLLLRSVATLAGSTAVGVGLITLAAAFDGYAQGALWVAAVALDVGGPFFFGAEGWRLQPHHFAERHESVIIIALGESIVAIGVGAGLVVTGGVVAAAVLGTAVAASFWWLYFDVVALVAARRLAEAPRGKVQNEMARDSYSYLHYVMVAGIVLVALGLKKTLHDVDHHLGTVEATALLGGAALYLLGHIAFRLRNVRTLNRQRLVAAAVIVALIPAATHLPALAALGLLTAILVVLIAYEAIRFADARARIRHSPRAT
jgi:low temperature requirement protein LtrA